MTDDENQTNLIDQYLGGNLNDDERRAFKKRMDDDRVFRKEVALQQKIAYTIQEQERATLKNDIKLLFEEEMNVQGDGGANLVAISSRRRYLAIAAAVALLVVAGMFFYVTQGGKQSQVAYLEVALYPRARGVGPEPDSLAVQILPENPSYNFHYQLGDTLTLYGNFDTGDMTILYEPNTEQYILKLDEQEYELENTKEVLPLE